MSNQFHLVDAHLARWLMTHERMGEDDFQLTREFLSNMLGVRREESVRQLVDCKSAI